ncbi:Homeobox-leucine zipper protein HOX19 [Hibiscus syriacus]|uniref:Homeobox-leucine zipper protein HOX19 n=1 Tax=Hibiscus syriacus TaxID=106335 RepID=A0A6A3AMM6_HIBSY|nr:homeobox-leucine zipper protein HAT22-like [Hibiscus syriacus]KAE8704092.1 Homeobox-leucine zipper protein HOX19 [Hibiscus syriacus]
MGLDDDDACNTGLVLGLGFSSSLETPTKNPSCLKFEQHQPLTPAAPPPPSSFEPLLTLGLCGVQFYQVNKKVDVNKCGYLRHHDQELMAGDLYRRQASPHSAVSSFSSGRVKRERELSNEEVVVENNSCRVSDEDEDGVNARKKLRLTKEQSAVLEEGFKQHSTLNPKQKQALAKQLNLTPRQVEVWFQNRRARTKLKQTEVDCEFLKKCCETLTDENRKLQKELQELKALKMAVQPFYMQMPAATLTMCPSCERIGGVADGNSKTPFSMASKPHFYNPFSNPSAAC